MKHQCCGMFKKFNPDCQAPVADEWFCEETSVKIKIQQNNPHQLVWGQNTAFGKREKGKISLDTRNLRSADDRLFTICNTIPNIVDKMGPSGDHCSRPRVEQSDQSVNPKIHSNGMPKIHNEGDHTLRVIDVE
nr:unnamed protein product [Callosobruchus analis]